MTTWYPDTCDCIADVEQEKILQPCRLHSAGLYADVLEHNRSFNLRHGSVILSENEVDAIVVDKAAEKLRIRRL